MFLLKTYFICCLHLDFISLIAYITFFIYFEASISYSIPTIAEYADLIPVKYGSKYIIVWHLKISFQIITECTWHIYFKLCFHQRVHFRFITFVAFIQVNISNAISISNSICCLWLHILFHLIVAQQFHFMCAFITFAVQSLCYISIHFSISLQDLIFLPRPITF